MNKQQPKKRRPMKRITEPQEVDGRWVVLVVTIDGRVVTGRAPHWFDTYAEADEFVGQWLDSRRARVTDNTSQEWCSPSAIRHARRNPPPPLPLGTTPTLTELLTSSPPHWRALAVGLVLLASILFILATLATLVK